MLDRARVLGLPGLDGGALVGLVVYDRDPVADLHMVDHPAHVVLGGSACRPLTELTGRRFATAGNQPLAMCIRSPAPVVGR